MGISRFQVMAVLQAARAYLSGLPIESAKSWGLNRAIFYAAAKKGFKKTGIVKRSIKIEEEKKEIEGKFKVFHLGDEMAYAVEKEGKLFFTIGNEIQTDKDFERQIEKRFGERFENVWNEAIEILKKYDEGVLKSQRYFFETIYKPRRDELVKKWG
jgi:hypothetical protein|uniref:Uncharacterized protein n=1 Tax=candidate division WOR-3 bacterium TaxID=2052148 RepID=A0A7C4YA84_UNCW3